MHTTYKCAVVTQQSPRVTVTMSWGGAKPTGEYRLYMKRVGETDEFAYYPAIEVKGGEATFQFDNLLFAKGTGRFVGRLVIDEVDKATMHFDYRATDTLVNVENPNV